MDCQVLFFRAFTSAIFPILLATYLVVFFVVERLTRALQWKGEDMDLFSTINILRSGV